MGVSCGFWGAECSLGGGVGGEWGESLSVVEVR